MVIHEHWNVIFYKQLANHVLSLNFAVVRHFCVGLLV